MIMNDAGIFWCDEGKLVESDLENYQGTLVCASKVKWRTINDSMGNKEFFIIYDRLKEIDADIMYSSYCYWIDIAKKLKNEKWLEGMAGLIENPRLYEMLSEEHQRLMSEYYKNFWR